MVRLADVSREYGTEIGDIVDDLTVLTPLNHLELRQHFNSEELAELRANLAEVRDASSENEKMAKLLEQGVGLLKLLRSVGVAI